MAAAEEGRPAGAKRRAWTKHEESVLSWAWGSICMDRLMQKLNRSRESIYNKARKMGLTGGPQGYHTLSQVADETGYDRNTIRRVAELHGILLRRRPRTRPGRHYKYGTKYAITDEQFARLIEVMKSYEFPLRFRSTKSGRWGEGNKPESCLMCHESSRKHASRGLCTRCRKRLHFMSQEEYEKYPRISSKR